MRTYLRSQTSNNSRTSTGTKRADAQHVVASFAPGSQAPAEVAELILSSPMLKSRLGYRRFARPDLDVLVVDAHYHLIPEVRRALAANGHRVSRLPVYADAESMIRGLLSALIQHRPDFILTVNHFGFDEGGAIGQILEALEIPVAAWYVDSPLFVLRGRPVPAAETSIVFTWERSLLPILDTRCAASYLPLGTDPEAFSGRASDLSQPAQGIAFVGDSGTQAQEKWRDRIDESDEPTVRRLEAAVQTRTLSPFAEPRVRNDPKAADRLAAATWRANSQHRVELLRPFVGSDLRIYGDDGWRTLLPEADVHHGPAYGSKLADIYRKTAVNLNVTSLQMPTAVNQRVFDVPAAGGFLLTDAQSDLFNLFRENEVATYTTTEEALDKARYYLRHPHRREALIERGQRRVLSDHTYTHRVASLVESMTRRFGPEKRAGRRAQA